MKALHPIILAQLKSEIHYLCALLLMGFGILFLFIELLCSFQIIIANIITHILLHITSCHHNHNPTNIVVFIS